MHIGKVWVEIPDLDPTEPTYKYLAKLAFEACEAGKFSQSQLMKTLCHAIVLVSITSVKECLVYECDWDIFQETFVEEQETMFIKMAVVDLEDCIRKRLTRTKKKERWMRTSIDDMKLSAVLIYIMSLPDLFEDFIQEKMALEYEAPK